MKNSNSKFWFEGVKGLGLAVDCEFLHGGVLVSPHEATTLLPCPWKMRFASNSWVMAAVVHPVLAGRLRTTQGASEVVAGRIATVDVLCVIHRVAHWEQRILVPLLGARAAAFRSALMTGAPLAYVLVHGERDEATIGQLPVENEVVQTLLEMPPVRAFDAECDAEAVRRLVTRLLRREARLLETYPQRSRIATLAVVLPDAMTPDMLCEPSERAFNATF